VLAVVVGGREGDRTVSLARALIGRGWNIFRHEKLVKERQIRF